MDRVVIPPAPEEPTITWSMNEPCGACRGCKLSSHIITMAMIVDDMFARLAADISPHQMRSDLYFERVDELVRRRTETIEQLRPANPSLLECEKPSLSVCT